jgi:hypothetical protein
MDCVASNYTIVGEFDGIWKVAVSAKSRCYYGISLRRLMKEKKSLSTIGVLTGIRNEYFKKCKSHFISPLKPGGYYMYHLL